MKYKHNKIYFKCIDLVSGLLLCIGNETIGFANLTGDLRCFVGVDLDGDLSSDINEDENEVVKVVFIVLLLLLL